MEFYSSNTLISKTFDAYLITGIIFFPEDPRGELLN